MFAGLWPPAISNSDIVRGHRPRLQFAALRRLWHLEGSDIGGASFEGPSGSRIVEIRDHDSRIKSGARDIDVFGGVNEPRVSLSSLLFLSGIRPKRSHGEIVGITVPHSHNRLGARTEVQIAIEYRGVVYLT